MCKLTRSAQVSDHDFEFKSLTRSVRHGTIDWSVKGYLAARAVVRRARSGELTLPAGAGGLPEDLLEEAATDEVVLGLWLRGEHNDDPPEVPAAHHLRFHAVEHFLESHADLLAEEGLVHPGPDGPEPDPLLLAELVRRPYDTALTSREIPGFDPGEVLKAVARRARQSDD